MENAKQMLADIKGKLDELETELEQLEARGVALTAMRVSKRNVTSWRCRMCSRICSSALMSTMSWLTWMLMARATGSSWTVI